jgi:prolyl-tRNA synthetase
MLWSRLHIPTLRDIPAEAEVVSHQLLLRAGYVRQLAAGIYSYLFLAQRSLLKIQNIVREEMNAIGGQEMLLPALQPAELWQASGRWQVMGDNMFRLKDRFKRDLCLGMTHEENMTAVARGELRSYKQLPQIWYQIQTKFRDEPRPKSGLLRIRQFLMKDAYSFDLTPEGLDAAYEMHHRAYVRIFDRCGLQYMSVDAHSGAMGGSQSCEFMVASDAGEDFVVSSPAGGYAANLETAVSRAAPPQVPDPEGNLEPEEFHTPGRKTIAEVCDFTRLPPTSQMKSLVMMADNKLVLALLRGDHVLSETKFASVCGAAEVHAAHPEDIRGAFGADPGSLGPLGVKNMRIIADSALKGRRNMICGANRDDYHLRNVTPGEDFEPEFADVRQVAPGDTSIDAGEPLEIKKCVELGHIFKLGRRYSEALGLNVTSETGEEVAPLMGSYGIGIERILCAAIELYHDKDGMALPPAIAPFQVVVTPVNVRDAALRAASERLYDDCKNAKLDVILDDRDERPGVKFKDNDLTGIPFRITVGKKAADGTVEIVERRPKQTTDVPVTRVVDFIGSRIYA